MTRLRTIALVSRLSLMGRLRRLVQSEQFGLCTFQSGDTATAASGALVPTSPFHLRTTEYSKSLPTTNYLGIFQVLGLVALRAIEAAESRANQGSSRASTRSAFVRWHGSRAQQ